MDKNEIQEQLFEILINDFEVEEDFKEKAENVANAAKGQLSYTPKQIAFMCRHGKTIKKIIDNVIDGETKRIEAGGDLREMKLVGGKLCPRQWVDEDAQKQAETMLKAKLGVAETYHPRKLITAPQALEKLKHEELSTKFTNKFDKLYHRPVGKPKLVPIDAEGEALVFTSIDEDFDIEVEDPEEVTENTVAEDDFSDLM